MQKKYYEPEKPKRKKKLLKISTYILFVVAILFVGIMALPFSLTLRLNYEQTQPAQPAPTPFPVSVDPLHKTIIDNPQVNAYLNGTSSPLTASAINSQSSLFEKIATALAETAFYQSLASAVGFQTKLVTVNPGLRKEQVATLFAKSLSWSEAEKQQLFTPNKTSGLPFSEGSFYPDTYAVQTTMTPQKVQEIINNRFRANVIAHYSTSTAAILPLNKTLIIASIIQRETISANNINDLRLISGIIWNRIFANMNLQVDSTLQYAVATTKSTESWWPTVVPQDKYIQSAYNTYLNKGLPPAPIANPSVAAIIAALNPAKTSCLYYFNDSHGNFHCSATYTEHVALLKKYYGQGK